MYSGFESDIRLETAKSLQGSNDGIPASAFFFPFLRLISIVASRFSNMRCMREVKICNNRQQKARNNIPQWLGNERNERHHLGEEEKEEKKVTCSLGTRGCDDTAGQKRHRRFVCRSLRGKVWSMLLSVHIPVWICWYRVVKLDLLS